MHTHHVQFHMQVAEFARSPPLKLMIDRQHVLILNWLFDLTGRRTPLPPGFTRGWRTPWRGATSSTPMR